MVHLAATLIVIIILAPLVIGAIWLVHSFIAEGIDGLLRMLFGPKQKARILLKEEKFFRSVIVVSLVGMMVLAIVAVVLPNI